MIPHTFFDIVRLIELDGIDSDQWCVLVPIGEEDALLGEVYEELIVQTGRPPRVEDVALLTPRDLIALVHSPSDDVLIVRGVGAWADDAWREADANRSALARSGTLIFSLDPSALRRFVQSAPNIRSWIGGHIFPVLPDLGLLTDEQRQKQLVDLRECYGFSDADIIRMSEASELPQDPDFIAWLAYLGRTDLAIR